MTIILGKGWGHAGQRDWKIRRLANKITSEFTHHDFFRYVPWTHFGSPLCIVACNNYAQLTQRAASCVISRCTHSRWSVDLFIFVKKSGINALLEIRLKKKKKKKYQHSYRDAQKQTTRCFFKIKIYITNSFIIIAIYIIIITMILVLLSFHSFFFLLILSKLIN